LISVFFLLPVVAALLLSFTDFDLYALADPATCAYMGRHYRTLLVTPLFWQALGNTAVSWCWGVPLSLLASLGAASAGGFALARLRPCSARVVRSGRHELVAVALICRYLLHTRYGLINYLLKHLDFRPSTGWAIRTGRCPPSCCSRVEEFRLHTYHPDRRAPGDP